MDFNKSSYCTKFGKFKEFFKACWILKRDLVSGVRYVGSVTSQQDKVNSAIMKKVVIMI